MRLGAYNLAFSSVSHLIEKKQVQAGSHRYLKVPESVQTIISKATESKKAVMAPYSMSKLLSLQDLDVYQFGCFEFANYTIPQGVTSLRNKNIYDNKLALHVILFSENQLCNCIGIATTHNSKIQSRSNQSAI